jgi:hypothetical protein
MLMTDFSRGGCECPQRVKKRKNARYGKLVHDAFTSQLLLVQHPQADERVRYG